ncbi:AI-2E family transporter [Clostridium sp. CT7]|uniref:AI-2E family transporter n=2 Tax=Clostridium TaxID=1485 RepID=UPI000824DA81|nr:AI-2E family transporter [Clostridium sp. CT7]PJI06689.1 AI-2E family transporter [Clostridium sp. CT7]
MKKVHKYIASFLIFVFICILLYFLFKKVAILSEILYIILIAFLLAYTLKPFHMYLMSIGIGSRKSAAVLLAGITFLCIAFLFFLVPSIFKETLNIDMTKNEIQYCMDFLNKKLKPALRGAAGDTLIITIYSKFNNELHLIISKTLNFIVNIGKNIVDIAIIPIISYYFLADGDNIKNKILIVFPLNYRRLIKKIMSDVDNVLSRYNVTQIILCTLIGVLTFIILIIFKVDYPIILSIVNGLFNIIPYFGPIFGAVPAVIIAFLKSTKTGIYTTVFLYVIQIIEGNIISPKMTGDSVNIHPLIVILLLIAGEKIAGFWGMILAIPVGVIIKVIYEDLNYYLF